MKGLYDALPNAKKGGYAQTSALLQDALLSNLQGGDVVMIKASNGTRLGAIVTALKLEFGNAGPVA
jgi:UDP-N-acetylmuramoyl-tripeptide--D-alanyl-D-alanine ligase